jgi:hypothetical protein
LQPSRRVRAGAAERDSLAGGDAVSGPDVTVDVERVVMLGASNLTRGFHTVVSTARAVWGPRIQVFAAFGHGRSYGGQSHVLVRTLPGILDSGLFRDLDALPPVPTRALVTDVGNDILYGFPGEQVVAWAEAAVDRLERTTRDITLTDLPLASIRRLSRARFLAFRSIFFPSCRLSLAKAVDAAERVNAGLEELSARHGLRFLSLKPECAGCPFHSPSLWRAAWQDPRLRVRDNDRSELPARGVAALSHASRTPVAVRNRAARLRQVGHCIRRKSMVVLMSERRENTIWRQPDTWRTS